MKTLKNARSQYVKATFIAILIALTHCYLVAEEGLSTQHLFSLSNHELAIMNMKVDHGCIFFLQWGRSVHEFDKRKKYPNAPEDQWLEYARNSLLVTGNSKVSPTSLAYILGEKMIEMAFSGTDPEVTGRTIYNECMKYEPKYSNTDRGDPNPRLRSSAHE